MPQTKLDWIADIARSGDLSLEESLGIKSLKDNLKRKDPAYPMDFLLDTSKGDQVSPCTGE